MRTVKSAPLARPSADLRVRVLNAIAPQATMSLLTKVINNLGNILAMGMVLTIVWYAGSNISPSNEGKQPSILSEAVKTYVDYYARARDFVAKKQVQLVGDAPKTPTPGNDNVIYLTVVSILILVAVDRFVVRRILKIRV
jgi:hypothetical protein